MKHWRFLVVQLLFIFLTVAVLGRLLYWQVVQHESLTARASNQQEIITLLEAKRGRIFASDGSLLAGNEPAFLLFANLSEFGEEYEGSTEVEDAAEQITEAIFPEILSNQKDPKKLAKSEKELLFIEKRNEIVANLNSENLLWIPLAKKISQNSKKLVENLEISGLGFEEITKRFYPEGSLASQLLGFVGKNESGNDTGYFGLEGKYNEQLGGKPGRLIQELDASGNPIITNDIDGSFPTDGFDITTTIDRNVQFIIENEIKSGVKKFGAKFGSVVIMDPKSGEILGMANYPNFTPAKWQVFEEKDYLNQVISDVYEPGSTFKLVTVASALDAGVVKPDTVCPCQGPIKVSGYEIQTWNNKYNPKSTIVEILQLSDNVGAGFVGRKLGKDKFLEYIRNFGFGSTTSIDLQGDESGLVKEIQDWSDVDLVTTSFGQGISVTDLQMANALGVIANEGKLMKPYVVKKISSAQNTITIESEVLGQVIKPETALLMKEMLLSAVEGGEAKNLIPKGYRVGGKTGTAQVAIDGKYDPNQSVASFVGFGPVEDPRFVMIVKYVDPTPIYGGETAEPSFFEIAKKLYPYWGIPVR